MADPMSWVEAYAKASTVLHPSIDGVIEALEADLPRGSGIDNGCRVKRSDPSTVVITFGYHHMNGDGYYTDWADYRATIRATFGGPELRVYGQDRNGLIDHLHETFHYALISRRVYVLAYDGAEWVLDDVS